MPGERLPIPRIKLTDWVESNWWTYEKVSHHPSDPNGLVTSSPFLVRRDILSLSPRLLVRTENPTSVVNDKYLQFQDQVLEVPENRRLLSVSQVWVLPTYEYVPSVYYKSEHYQSVREEGPHPRVPLVHCRRLLFSFEWRPRSVLRLVFRPYITPFPFCRLIS